MSRAKKILVAGGTFSVALGIGFVMQNGDVLAARFGAEAPAPRVQEAALTLPVQDAQQTVAEGPTLALPQTELSSAIMLPGPASEPAMPQPPVQLATATDTNFATDARPEPQTVIAAAPDCTPVLTAAPLPAALVDLTLDAPCNPSAAVTIHHQGMMFKTLTDADGHLEVTVPALKSAAVFMASFPSGAGTVATALVPGLASYDRAVLQWQGPAGFGIHAYEFGAGFEDKGHIWDQSPGTEDAALNGTGGFLLRFGDPDLPDPLMAEVYTFPTATAGQPGDVSLAAEAVVTAANCGREVSAQSIQVDPAGAPSALDLTMTMPGCDAVGEYLEIKPMFSDIRVASR